MENKGFLATEPVGKLLRQLALPTVIAQLINMLYNIVDRMFIGHIPQTGALCLNRCWCLYAVNYDCDSLCLIGW